jgi:ribonucleoside-diphosphate reductase alpha chain
MLNNAVKAATKGRGLGLGVMGWSTLLQKNMIPFESFTAMTLNSEIFSKIDREAQLASMNLATLKGEPEWCAGTGMRNTHLTAVAPTKSNSVINGNIDAGIEVNTGNAFLDVTPKGVFVRRNKTLTPILKQYNLDNEKVWKSIEKNFGSINHLNLPQKVKDVFKTAYEINQMNVIKQVAQRTPFISQSQSVNLFFSNEVDPKFFADVHIEAWKLGVKTLYYCKSIAARVESNNSECLSCEG